MVKIRLMRVGKRKQPSYRVVVADSRSPRDGRIIEAIGHYHPRQEPSVVEIDNERALHWLQHGAKPSNTVKNLLTITGAWSEFTGEAPPAPRTATPADRPTVKATPAASVADDAAAETESDEMEPEAGEEEAAEEVAQAESGEQTDESPDEPDEDAEKDDEATS